MALLSDSDIETFKTAFAEHFETFSHNRARLITIYKEPIKTISNISSNPVYGYTESSNIENITYTPVTGIYPAMIVYSNPQSKLVEEARTIISTNQVRIKVEEDAKDFIEDGRQNERVEFEGKSFNFVAEDYEIQNYFGLKYYIYKLEMTS